MQKLPNSTSKFIKSLRLKKYRQQENAFIVEGAKSVCQLLTSDYTVQLLVGTPAFLDTHSTLWAKHHCTTFHVDEATLTKLGALKTNSTALAVAQIPNQLTVSPSADVWGLVLDNIRDPGNLGTIVRLADWYNIPAVICSPTTVDLYNAKVLQASMGSFTRVQVYYTSLPQYLEKAFLPVIGTFTTGQNIHHTALPLPSLIVIGNESKGISPALLPYIRQHICIPRYGQAESLNAAMATAIICDHWRQG